MVTRGGRPVLSECSSTLDAMICVVISASAATPAPQQLQKTQDNMSHLYKLLLGVSWAVVRYKQVISTNVLLWKSTTSGLTH